MQDMQLTPIVDVIRHAEPTADVLKRMFTLVQTLRPLGCFFKGRYSFVNGIVNLLC